MSWNQLRQIKLYTSPQVADVRDERVAPLSKVYGWMFVGLLITAVIAFAVASSPTLIETLILNRSCFGVADRPAGSRLYLSARVDKLAPATAAGLFALYRARGRDLVRDPLDLHRLDNANVHHHGRNVWCYRRVRNRY